MIRWIIGILITVSALIIISVALLFSPVGLKITLSIAQKFVPGELQYKTISGPPIGPITVTDLSYHYKDTSIYIKKLHFQWRPNRLLQGRLDIKKLSATGVNITLPSKGNSTQFTAPNFTLPIELHIAKAIIHDIKIGQSKDQYPVHIDMLKLKAEITAKKLHINVNGHLEKPYPLKVRLVADGTMNHYHLKLIAQSHDINWTITGEGGQQWIHLQTHEARTLGGSLNGDVVFHWSPSSQWKINLNVQHLNVRKFYKNWPTDLTFKLISEGQLQSGQLTFSLDSHLQTPGASIQVSGTHDRQWNIHWKISATQLSTIVANYSGSLHGEGTIKGNTKRPIWNGNLTGTNVTLFNYHIDKLNAEWFVDLSYQRSSHIMFKSTHLETQHILLSTFNVSAIGRPHAHKITAQITLSEPNAGITHVNLTLNGEFLKNIWRGQLTQFNIQSKVLGQWHLSNPAQLQISSAHMTTTPICIHSSRGRACLQGGWSKNKAWQTTFTATGVNITPLLSLLKLDFHVRTPVNIDAKAIGQGQKFNHATLTMKFGRGSLHSPAQTNHAELHFINGTLTAVLDSTGLNANLQLHLSARDTIHARILLPGYAITQSLNSSQPVQGVITINTSDLRLLQQFMPDIIQAKGQLLANLNIGGTISHPKLNGQIKLQQGSAQIPQLRLTLTKVTINLTAVASTIKYSVEAYSQNKLIQISGTTQLDTPGRSTHLTVQGNDVLIMNTPEYLIYVTAALTVDIKGHQIQIGGTITIPRADLKPLTLSGAVSLPEDVVFVGPTVKKQEKWYLTTNVKIIIGDNVMVDSHGLTGRLTGQIVIVKTPAHTYIVNGKIGIIDGVYTTHGKTLIIEPGSMITFTQSPLKNPNLNIRAVKKVKAIPQSAVQAPSFGTITVGLNIQGTLRHPNVSLFSSSPNLSQADILSYLLFGHPSNSNTPSNVSFLLEAIDTLNLGGGKGSPGGIADQISQGLGLSEFGIESQTTLDALGTPLGTEQSAFVVGRYISPRIYVRYSRGLVIPINIVQVRYLFGNNWAIQTDSSSLGNGVDVLYTIQKN